MQGYKYIVQYLGILEYVNMHFGIRTFKKKNIRFSLKGFRKNVNSMFFQRKKTIKVLGKPNDNIH